MTEEDSDFLNETIEFGDGKQYTVSHTVETEPEPAATSGDRLGNDFDRSWPPKEPPPQSAVSATSVSPLSSKPPGERLLFNDRHNRMEPPPQPRQHPTSPTLLNANPTPASVRGSAPRRGSFNKGFRDSSSWNTSQRGPGPESDRDREGRGRRPSATEQSQGLGPHLRDRSPDSSGRFPGRHIPPNARRDSQASSGMVTRPGRDHSRESSDRGSLNIRQLPPHLSASKNGHGAPPSGPAPSATRTSWRDSRGSGMSQAPRSPMETIQQQGALPNGAADVKTFPSAIHAVPENAAVAAAAFIDDEAALKAAMAVAAERARKRRQEEEEAREKERQRAKQKLAELEARLQAQKEAQEAAEREKEEQKRKEQEEKERLAKLEVEKAERAEKDKRDAERTVKERPGPTFKPPPRPQMPADKVDSWRTGPPRPPTTTGTTSSKPSLKQEPRSGAAPKSPDLRGKPANAAIIAEVAALQSKADESVEVLDFSDLRQLAEEYSQTHPTDITSGNGSDGSSKRLIVKLPVETRSTRPQMSGQDGLPASTWRRASTDAQGSNIRPHSPTHGHLSESKGFKASKPSGKAPAPLNLAPRDAQEHGPPSGGLGSARSPRTADSHGSYRQAPISVLDDTLSRFKQALMVSNPNHAGMSSLEIMEGLGKVTGTVGDASLLSSDASIGEFYFLECASSQPPTPAPTNAAHKGGPDLASIDPEWSQTQTPNEEEEDGPNVLIPTFSLRRDPVPLRRLQAMKTPQPWRWDLLTFDPPIVNLNKKTLSVFEFLQPKQSGPLRVKVKIPGSAPSTISLPESSQPNSAAIDRPRRGEAKVNGASGSSPTVGLTPASSKPTSIWPPKSKGSDEAVWRRAVPISQPLVSEDLAASPNPAEGSASPATPKSSLSMKHSRAFVSLFPHKYSHSRLTLRIVHTSLFLTCGNPTSFEQYLGPISIELNGHRTIARRPRPESGLEQGFGWCSYHVDQKFSQGSGR